MALLLKLFVAVVCVQQAATFAVTSSRVAMPTAAPVRCASPQMVFGGGSRRTFFRAVRSVKPRMPNLPGKRWSGPGMSGGDGGDGGDTSPAAPEPSDDGDKDDFMAGMWKGYSKMLDEQPLLTKALTSFTGFALGDILAQLFIQKTNPFDWARLLRLSSFGFLVHGTSSHWFYGFLDGKIPGKSAQVVFSKVFIDQVLWNPIFGIMFFSYVAAFELKGFDYVKDKVQNELLTQVTGSWKVWPLAHAINFRFIPSSQRVLYINSIQIGYNCLLSLISNRETEATA